MKMAPGAPVDSNDGSREGADSASLRRDLRRERDKTPITRDENSVVEALQVMRVMATESPLSSAPPPPAAARHEPKLEALLAHIHPFSHASAAARARFALTARRQRLDAGERFWQAGEEARDFSFVRKGLVKLVRPRAGGRSDIIGIFGPSEAIGIITAFRHIPYPADAVAASSRAEVIHVPSVEALDVSRREPAFANAIADCCASRACRMRDMTAILSAGGVASRLAAFLMDLADRFGDIDDEDASLHVPVVLSRAELAACTSTTPESAIRAMSQWARQGLVRTERDGFVICDPERLRELAEPVMIRPPSASRGS